MRLCLFLFGLLVHHTLLASPQFKKAEPLFQGHYAIDGALLCHTAKNTLEYLNKGTAYDPEVIHGGKLKYVPLEQVKATLVFICKNQDKMNDPQFIKEHFDFIRWYPDKAQAQLIASHKPLLQHLPTDSILMTKYYVHLAQANNAPTSKTPYALYALPDDERHLSLEQANQRTDLIRLHYGKQAILKGALLHKPVNPLAYLSREDLEASLLQGSVVADLGVRGRKIFNVHRNNNRPYDRTKPPYAQERFWYFKEVDGIKGYGKDAEYKITIDPKVVFAADLAQFGLGKVLFIQYRNASKTVTSQAGILADTGGAFVNNAYQVDYLAGSYPGAKAFYQATHHLPDYVDAYLMVLKKA